MSKLTQKSEQDVYYQLVAPVLVHFVEWVFQIAIEKKVKKIFFLSRDGQILYKIAKELTKSSNLDIECKYFYASRHALHLPGHRNIEESISWLLDNTAFLSLEVLAERAEIPLSNFKKVAFKYLNVSLQKNLSKIERKELLKIAYDKDFLRLLNKSSSDKFNITKKYFLQEGLIDENNNKKIIVDVGWNGRIQRSINNILEKSHISPNTIYGCYFALAKNIVLPNSNFCTGFIYDPFKGCTQGEWINKYRAMIEFFLEADHPSVKGYSHNKNHVTVRYMKDRKNYISVNLKHEIIIKYTLDYIRYAHDKKKSDINTSINNLKRFLEKPTYQEAEFFSKYSISEQQVEKKYHYLVKKFSLLDLLIKKNDIGLWKEASYRISNLFIFFQIQSLIFLFLKYFKFYKK